MIKKHRFSPKIFSLWGQRSMRRLCWFWFTIDNSIHSMSMLFDLQGKHYSLSSGIQPAALPSSTAQCKDVTLPAFRALQEYIAPSFRCTWVVCRAAWPDQPPEGMRKREGPNSTSNQKLVQMIQEWKVLDHYTVCCCVEPPIFVGWCRGYVGVSKRRLRYVIEGRGEQAGCASIGSD